MANSISSLLDISGRALAAQGQVIRTIGNNIANVNTPGYSRREVDLAAIDPTRVGQLTFGNGVEVSGVSRQADEIVNRQLRSDYKRPRQIGDSKRISLAGGGPIFSRSRSGNIGAQLSNFFSALDDLAANPSSTALRTRVIDAGTDLANTIGDSFNELASLQRQADTRIGTAVGEINSLSQQIAEVNEQITAPENSGQQNLGLRDTRENLLRELAGKITFQTVETSDGAINVTLDNGFGLVVGNTNRKLEFVTQPTFQPAGGYPRALDGNLLGHIVYDFDQGAGASHIDLTGQIASAGGSVAGLLNFRGVQSTTDTTSFDAQGSVVEIATRVELIARDLVGRFNRIYSGPDENPGAANWQSSSTSLNDIPTNTSSTPVFGLFTFAQGVLNPTDSSGTTGLADDSDISASLTAMGVGDVASRLRFAVSDPRAFAAGRDLIGGTANQGNIRAGSGDATNITGTPANAAIGQTAYLGLSGLRSEQKSYSLGGVTFNGTVEQLYNETVSFVGTEANRAKRDLDVNSARESQMVEFQQAISGVNLEEFANLVQFQKAFEASARMIKIGSDLFTEIINIVR